MDLLPWERKMLQRSCNAVCSRTPSTESKISLDNRTCNINTEPGLHASKILVSWSSGRNKTMIEIQKQMR